MINKYDLVILLVILVCGLLGYYRGLIKSILSVAQFFIITILTIFLVPMVSKILIEKFDLDIVIVEWAKNNQGLFPNFISIISENILKNIAGRIIYVLAGIMIFIVLKILFAIIVTILNKIASLPILNVANKFGGLIFGVINGILVVYLTLILINWLPFNSTNTIKKELDKSVLGTKIGDFVPEVANEVVNLVKISI